MSDTTTIRVSRETHDDVLRLAHESHRTVADTVARAVRLSRQEEMGRELAAPLAADEASWLDADAGSWETSVR